MANGYQFEVNSIRSVRCVSGGRVASTCSTAGLPAWRSTNASLDLSTAPLICCTAAASQEGSAAIYFPQTISRDGMHPLTLRDAALFTDLYELTMAAAFFREGMRETATFSLFARRLPPTRAFIVAAGLEDALEYARGLHFTSDAIEYLRSLGRFEPEFLEYLGLAPLHRARSARCPKAR